MALPEYPSCFEAALLRGFAHLCAIVAVLALVGGIISQFSGPDRGGTLIACIYAMVGLMVTASILYGLSSLVRDTRASAEWTQLLLMHAERSRLDAPRRATKLCPTCCETIGHLALVCPHCRHDFQV